MSDLTQIFEVSCGRASSLRRVGVRNFDDLCRRSPESLEVELVGVGLFLSATQVRRMHCHVRSYREGRPVCCGPLPSLGDEFA